MNNTERIERIEKERKAQGLSYQQLADMSQVSPSTVYRTVSGKTVPEEYTLQAFEIALGVTDEPAQDHLFEEGTITPLAERYIRTLESRIGRMRAHYNMLMAVKNRWLMLSFTMNIILIVFFICWIIYDINTPAIGWVHG